MSLKLARRVLEVLPPIVHRIRSDARVVMKPGMTLPQFRILSQIARGLDSVSAMAENQAVAQPTMSKMVDGLVKRGLVKRQANPNDRRQYKLVLTRKGASIQNEGLHAVEWRLASHLKTLKPAELRRLSSSLETLHEFLRG